MKYKGEVYEVVHQDAVSMYKVGAISDERMKEYDEMCLVQESPAVYEAEKSLEPSVQAVEHVTV
jgi:DNA-binding transcriptional regulator YiaG